MSVVSITDEDILRVEEKFVKFGLIFDDESREFIKCLESKDIQACPGAGKTTSLVAKLDILSSYMPFENNSGILVLTHTNVAVDEIKNKLGLNAQKVLGYPNHVGTFQSFVNKYLAMPMYIQLFKRRPERIDSEYFYSLFQKQFDAVNTYHRDWLEQRASEKYINTLVFIEKLELVDDNKLQYKGRNVITTRSSMFESILTISNIPKRLKDTGYLTYEECYNLALKYLNDYPSIIEVFQKRFQYVFIDEAQDTDDRQFEIINKLFNEGTTVQRIGDKNQAIFNFSGQKSKGWDIDENYIEIKNTKRLSSLVSNQVMQIAIERQELNGNEDIDIQPTIILFDNVEDVLPKFGALIIENGLHLHESKSFKAIGAIAKQNDKYDTILDYFPEYQRNITHQLGDTLVEKLNNVETHSFQLKDYKDIVLDILKSYLNEKNILHENKKITKDKILSLLKAENEDIYDEFKLELFHTSEKLRSGECIQDEIRELLKSFLELRGESIDNNILDEVIKTYKIQSEYKSKQNIYTYEENDISFDIDISTIHKVKGETHTATLVLETYNDGYDVFQLLDFLKRGSNKLKIKDKKKLLYVGMSRPTHLLCLAVHKKHMHRKKEKEVKQEDINILRESGFKVVIL